jgi:hypothetical protein
MKTETIIPNKLKTELSRWAIQFLLMLLAIPYGFIVLLMLAGEIISFFSSLILFLLYYLNSVYFHYRIDKNYTFKNPWWKSNRVYSTLFLIIPLIILNIFNKKINGLGITFELIMTVVFLIFLIFCVIYTWMLSEFMCKKLKSDKNLSFHYPIWFSKRFFLMVGVVLLLALTVYALNIKVLDTYFYEEVNANNRENFYDLIRLFGLILFYITPFFILNFISELKNRSLNKKQIINYAN